jgi:chromosome segregation ATPase
MNQPIVAPSDVDDGEYLKVPGGDASRLEWARYFLASAREDVRYKVQALTWNREQIDYHRRRRDDSQNQIAYHCVKLREYLADCKELEVRIKAAREEVERLEELVSALEAASVDAAHD